MFWGEDRKGNLVDGHHQQKTERELSPDYQNVSLHGENDQLSTLNSEQEKKIHPVKGIRGLELLSSKELVSKWQTYTSPGSRERERNKRR